VAAWNRPCAQAQARTGTCRWKALRLLDSVKLDGSGQGRELGAWRCGFHITIVWHDKKRLLVTLPGLCRPKKAIQVVVFCHSAQRAVGWPKLVGTASIVSPPRVEDAGNGYLTLSLPLCWGGAHASCLVEVGFKSWKGESLKPGSWASGGCS
jgi:hypothetical protein